MKPSAKTRRDLLCLALAFCLALGAAAAPTTLTVEWYSPAAYTTEEQAQNRAFENYMRAHPEVKIMPWSSLRVQGASEKSGKLMAVAGGMAPDIWRMWFHEVLKYANQGFLQPLNEYIGEDKDGDGRIEGDEVRYAPWSRILPQYKAGCVKDGKVYALPYDVGVLQVICYRRDLFRRAGLDPDKPPLDWDELYRDAQKLTFNVGELPGLKKEQRGLYFPNGGYLTFNPLVWAAGGELVLRHKTCPKCRHETEKPPEELVLKCAACGADLKTVPERWRAGFNSPEGLKAMEFLHKLRWQKWTRCPDTKEPFDLTDADLKAGKAVSPYTHKEFALSDAPVGGNVHTGVLFIRSSSDQATEAESFAKGRVGMYFMYSSEAGKILSQYGLPPDLLGMGPPPPVPGGKVVANAQPVMFGISKKDGRGKTDEKVAWDILASFTSADNLKERVKVMVEGGQGGIVYPEHLKAAGFLEIFASPPKSWQDIERRVDVKRAEPFNNGWTEVQAEVTPAIVDAVLKNPDVNLKELLAKAELSANAKFETWPEETLAKWRPYAWVFWALTMVAFFLGIRQVVNSMGKKVDKRLLKDAKDFNKAKKFKPIYLWVLPAFLSVLLWSYYPLLRGSVMAFQDYKIAGGQSWVGVDNFIMILGSPDFYLTMLRTLYYVGLTILVGFVAPILLAILLTEVPHGKYLFRTLFYLPAVTSGLVIMFMWKQFYDTSPTGFLNQLVIGAASLLGVSTSGFQWLNDPNLAMLCVVIPGVWAGAGAGSLIYQAALVSVSGELYEAADVDGAGLLAKIRHITIPTLKPLIIINFVGVFIGSFHAMQNIFVMTGGGPDNATRVIGMDIWFNAFMYLRFGFATAMAWILGVMLIGFTVMQLKILSKVEFRKADEN